MSGISAIHVLSLARGSSSPWFALSGVCCLVGSNLIVLLGFNSFKMETLGSSSTFHPKSPG